MYSEKINEMIATSMKNGNQVELSVWRAIKAAFINYTTSKAGNTLDDSIELNIINKLVAQRKDSIEQYTKANRIDLAQSEQLELDVLMSLLPAEPTEDDIKNEIEAAIKTLDHFPPTMADMKTVMAFVKNKYPTVNGGIVSKILKTYM